MPRHRSAGAGRGGGDALARSAGATSVGDYRDAETVSPSPATWTSSPSTTSTCRMEVLHALADVQGVAVHPGHRTLQQFAQDKILMRAKLRGARDAAALDWAAVPSSAQLQESLDAHGGRAVVKTPRGGYDGKGVRRRSKRRRGVMTGSRRALGGRTRRRPPRRGARGLHARARPVGRAPPERRGRRMAGRRDRCSATASAREVMAIGPRGRRAGTPRWPKASASTSPTASA